MKFCIKNKENKVMFSTEQESCIPIENLDSMSNAGLEFYVDNKRVSASYLRTQFSSAETTHVSEESTVTSEMPHPDSTSIDVSHLDFPLTSRTIVCLNNQKVYRNQKEAAEDLQIDINWVSYSITQNREYKGYTFKKVADII